MLLRVIFSCISFSFFGPAILASNLSTDHSAITPIDQTQKLLNLAGGSRNISTNGWVDEIGLLAGFIVEGTLSRPFAITGEDQDGRLDAALILSNLDGTVVLGSNDDWQTHPTATQLQSTLRPLGRPSDAGFLVDLSPGVYVARLYPADGRPARGLVSITDLGTASDGGLRNISTNGWVDATGLLAGFIVEGGTRRYALMGESQNSNLDAALSLARLGSASILHRNDNWQTHPTAAEMAGALRPLGRASDAGFIVELAPGAYVARLYPGSGQPARGLVSITDLDEADTVDPLQTVIDDMRLPHEERASGVPLHYDWALEPVIWGHEPGANTALLAWGQLYEDIHGNPASNTRVQIRDIRAYYLSRRDDRWHLLQASRLVEGAAYVEDFVDDLNIPADIRREADGSISVTAGNGYNFHFWTPERTLIDRDDIAGIFTTVEARLVVDNPALPDDRDRARYLLNMGADYWLDLTVPWDQWTTNTGIGMGRFKYVKKYWQSFTMITLPQAEVRRNPPPLN